MFVAACLTAALAWKDIDNPQRLQLNPLNKEQIEKKIGAAVKLDKDMKIQRIQIHFREFVDEAASAGLINTFISEGFYDRSTYQEIFSRFATIGDERLANTLDLNNLRIEGIQRCGDGKFDDCKGAIALANKF